MTNTRGNAEYPCNPAAQAVRAIVKALIAQRHQRLETACEAALQSGHYGVLIDGDTITLTDKVPYGQIHEIRRTAGDVT